MLYLVSTPIGNLGDISFRAIEILKNSELILCEDTRHSQILFNHYQINCPVQSYHQFNEKKQLKKLLQQLKEGKNISLISDAGTPLISDPGQFLVQACIEQNLPITGIPGPCSAILALQLSGFSTKRFQFIGFLPRNLTCHRSALNSACFYHGTTIAFESPKRLLFTLKTIQNIDPKRIIAIVREMTKQFEECLRGTASYLIEHFEKHSPRGEITLLFSEGEMEDIEMPLEELVLLIQEEQGVDLKKAITIAARLKNVSKKQVYRIMHCERSKQIEQ